MVIICFTIQFSRNQEKKSSLRISQSTSFPLYEFMYRNCKVKNVGRTLRNSKFLPLSPPLSSYFKQYVCVIENNKRTFEEFKIKKLKEKKKKTSRFLCNYFPVCL